MKKMKKRLVSLAMAVFACSFALLATACEMTPQENPQEKPKQENPQEKPKQEKPEQEKPEQENPQEPIKSGFEVYSGMDLNNKLVTNDYTTTIKTDSAVSQITLTGLNATKTLAQNEYKVENDKLTIYGQAFGSTIYGNVAIAVDFENENKQTLQEKVVTKYFSSAEDLQNMIWYGGYAGFDRYNVYIGEEKTYDYDGYFELSENINAYGNPYADRTYYWYHPNNEWNASYPYEMGSQGFRGVFDGAGYTIYNYSASGKFSGGLFGGVAKRAVIKNLGLVATLSVGDEKDGTHLVNVFAFNFSGTMQNCYVDVTVDEGSTYTGNGYQPIGMHLALSRFKDVVIRFDTENVPVQVDRVGCIGGTLSRSHYWSNPTTFDNLHIVLLENYSSNYELGSWYGATEEISKDGCTMHDFYDENGANITMRDTAFWDFSGAYPIFKSAK